MVDFDPQSAFEAVSDGHLAASSDDLWSVAVNAPMGVLHYLVPKSFNRQVVAPGLSMKVPLGKRMTTGVLLEQVATSEINLKLRRVIEPLPGRPQLEPRFIEWLKWMSRYYIYPLGQTMDLCFPPLAKGTTPRNKSRKSPLIKTEENSTKESFELNAEQKVAVEVIDSSSQTFKVHLLFGVTGSGKTEVYMELIARALAKGQKALVLVPEISLTPQLIDRFSKRFGQQTAVIHSHLTPREKTEQWWSAVNGEKSVLIGARSALFCPVKNLGLIVIDEEHESSFKQDESLRYHARDAAIMLARNLQIPIVLGSATPSLETWSHATQGRYQLHELKSRAKTALMPEITIVDLKAQKEAEKRTDGKPFWLSQKLETALQETLDRKEQAALFLNRRGVAQSVVCPSCGVTSECPNCAVSLTLHGRTSLVCHYCDYQETLRENCKECKNGSPQPLGLGTELVESDLQKIFPDARILRMDRDEIQNRTDLETAISAIENRDIDFLIGTQMIAKGLDFPGLTTVGLILADVGLNMPDFRAAERGFQLLTQVAGRAGRHLTDRRGQVLVQTFNPKHPSIQFALQSDYQGFAATEIEHRGALDYPPLGRLGAIRFAGPDLEDTEKAAHIMAHALRNMIHKAEQTDRPIGLQVLGPAPAPFAKLRNLYRFHILVKGPGQQAPVSQVFRVLNDSVSQLKLPSKVKVQFDIDAFHLL